METKNNLEIRSATRAAGLKLGQVAKAYGMTDSSFSRLMRDELSEENKRRVMEVIRRLQSRPHARGVQACDRS